MQTIHDQAEVAKRQMLANRKQADRHYDRAEECKRNHDEIGYLFHDRMRQLATERYSSWKRCHEEQVAHIEAIFTTMVDVEFGGAR